MIKKVVLLLLFISLAVWCQTENSAVAEKAFWRPYRSIKVISPDGGETWYADSIYNVTWRSRGWINFVKIEYSTDSDSTWNFITRRTRNDGSYSWEVPDTPSDYCLVRISSLYGPASDKSDSVFSIVSGSPPPDSSYIIITEPNGGETWHADTANYIAWDSYNTSGAVKIEYTLNAYDSLAEDSTEENWISITDNTADYGYFIWLTPSGISSDNCLIKVSDVDGSPSDMSDYPFSIIPLDSVPPDSVPSDSFPSDSFFISSSAALLPKAYSMDTKSINSSRKLVINYGIPKKASIKLVVYDILGARIKDISEEKSAGYYSTELDLRSKPGGIYFVRIQANGNEFAKTSKVLLLK